METCRVLVIGAGSCSQSNPFVKGIGTCLVERLAQKGYSPILFTYYNSEDGASQLAKRAAMNYHLCEVDSFRFNSIDYLAKWPALEKRLAESGTPDIFVYNSGLRFYKRELTEKEKEETMAVNYRCPAFLIEQIGNLMAKERKNGRIIVTGSVFAGKHHQFLEEYCLSKGLLEEFVRKNFEFWRGKGIGLYVVSPNITKTPMTEERIPYYEELARVGKLSGIQTAEEVAEAIVKLCI